MWLLRALQKSSPHKLAKWSSPVIITSDHHEDITRELVRYLPPIHSSTMYVQKKLMAKMEQERLADLASVQQQQQIDALKTFASLQQMNSMQQQQLTAFLTAAIYNKNLLLNQQQQLNATSVSPSDSSEGSSISQSSSTSNLQNSSAAGANSSSVNSNGCSNKLKQTTSRSSRKRSISDAFSSSEEEPYCYAKLRWVDLLEMFCWGVRDPTEDSSVQEPLVWKKTVS